MKISKLCYTTLSTEKIYDLIFTFICSEVDQVEHVNNAYDSIDEEFLLKSDVFV